MVDVKSWERQRDSDGGLEPRHWYERFSQFRLMGADRSLLEAYRHWKAQGDADARDVTYVAKAWERAAEKWRWRERARAWDEEQARAKKQARAVKQGEKSPQVSEEVKLWERQPWDTSAGFRSFHEFYLPQKPPRSVDQAYRDWYIQYHKLQSGDISVAKKRAPGTTWQNWSRGKKRDGTAIEGAVPWSVRAEQWDKHLADLDHALWEDRRRKEREAEWEDAISLRERAEKMERFPLAKVERVEETYEDGRPRSVTIVHPANWGERDVARHKDLAAKLARLAASMGETARTEALNIDVSKLTMGQLERIAKGEDPIAVLATSGEGGVGETTPPTEG